MMWVRKLLVELRDIKNVAMTLSWMIFDNLLFLVPTRTEKKGLALIRTDMLGDYVLFRNYLACIRRDSKYNDSHIVLIGNMANRQLAETIDHECVDEFWWLDRRKFIRDPWYRFKILKRVRKAGFRDVFYTSFTREYAAGDALARVSAAENCYGRTGATPLMARWQSRICDRLYNRPLATAPEVRFEFLRNAEMVGKFLDRPVSVSFELPRLNFEQIDSKPYAVISPGVGGSKIFSGLKQWDPANFLQTALELVRRHKLQIKIVGTADQAASAAVIERGLPPGSCVNEVGKTTLIEMIKIVQGARLLLSNDTGSVHVAAASGVHSVCVSNGLMMGEFTDYPKEVAECIKYVYPQEIPEEIADRKRFYSRYSSYSILDINTVTPDRVIRLLQNVNF